MDAIIKIESGREDIISEFNSYLQQGGPKVSFVQNGTGYFRLQSELPSSAGIEAFGKFLQTTGFTISAIESTTTSEGGNGTSVCFTKGGKTECAVLSTLNIY